MPIYADSTLGITSLDVDPAELRRSEPCMAYAGPAGTSTFLLEGQRVVVRGSERAGISAIWIDGQPALGAISSDAGACSSVVVTPAQLRRETVGRYGVVLETTLALPTLPLVAVQWTAPERAPRLEAVELTVHLLPGAADVGFRCEGGRLQARDPSTDRSVELALHPAPSDWRVEAHDDGGARITARSGAPGVTTLLVSAGDEAARRGAFAAAPHLAGHAHRADLDSDPSASELLTLRTGVREVDDGWAWAVARTRRAHRGAREGSNSPGAAANSFWTGIGALSVGEVETAVRALGRMDGSPDPPVDLGLGTPASTPALATLLAARIASATGDVSTAVERLRTLQPPDIAALRATCTPDEWAYWRFALEELADSLRFTAPDHETDRLRAAARLQAPGPSVRLPMAGRPSTEPTGAEALRWLLGGAPSRQPAPSHPPPAERLAPWWALHRGESDQGWALWRAALAEGLGSGPAGRGTWDSETSGAGTGRPGAAMILAAMVHGVLGIHYDAPTGRLGLAPSLPRHVARFEADQIPAGDGRISMAYERMAGGHRFVLTPRRCRVPPVVVFQPALEVGVGAVVSIDGASADLEITTLADRTRYQVQLPIDGVRTVEIAGSTNNERPGGSSPPDPSVP